MNKLMILLLLSLCSCATLSTDAQKLIVVNDVKYVVGCSYVGTVTSSSMMFGDPVMTMIMNSDSLTTLKNRAAKVGNVLVLTENRESAITGSNRAGNVYKCPDNIQFVQAK